MHTTKKIVALGATVGLAAIGIVVASPSASATGTWKPAIGSTVVSPGDQFTGSGTLTINGTYNGAATAVTCTISSGALTWTVPTPVPSAAPLGTLTLSLSVPTNLTAGGYASCQDSVTHSAVNVTTSGAAWSISVPVPDDPTTHPSIANPFTGTLTGTVSIPANALTAQLTGLPGTDPSGKCTVTGPSSAFNGTGNYNASTGVLGVSPADQVFNLGNAQCPKGGTVAKLHSGTATLTKVGGSGVPDLFFS